MMSLNDSKNVFRIQEFDERSYYYITTLKMPVK